MGGTGRPTHFLREKPWGRGWDNNEQYYGTMVFMLLMMTYGSAADYDNDDDKENDNANDDL